MTTTTRPSAATDAAPSTVKPFPTTAAPAADAAPAKKGRKKLVLGILALVVLGVGGTLGYDYWTVGRFMVKTDDAYVQADITLISSRVQGYIRDVKVVENQAVKAGDVILTLDDGDYRIALDQAKNKLTTLDETLLRIDAQIVAAEAAVTQAQAQRAAIAATVHNATTTVERTRELAANKVSSQAQLDNAEADLQTAVANLAGAEAQIASAEANVAVINAQRAETAGQKREFELAVDQAQRDLDLTVLRAPTAGVVANLSSEIGDLVSPGARLAAVVPTEGVYIEAYYKETQMTDLTPGKHAKVTIDALEGQEFDGVITSTAPATGAIFSLLPPDNATGNFTKIVQRVPVRISLPPEALQGGQLRAGLSAVVEIDIRDTK